MMNELLSLDSDKYLRRLVKEIRASFEHGVYVELVGTDGTTHNVRINWIELSKGLLICRAFSSGKFEVSRTAQFSDGYGRNICASRH
jgi:hypothetical protein